MSRRLARAVLLAVALLAATVIPDHASAGLPRLLKRFGRLWGWQ